MLELLTAIGAMFLSGVIAWYFDSLLLRVAAFWCFIGAGLLLLVASQGEVSPWAGPAMFAWGARCWTLGHALHRVRRGWWGVTAGRPSVLRPAAPPPPARPAGGRGTRPRPAALIPVGR